MDREIQISWLMEFADMSDEGLTCLERLISRLKQTNGDKHKSIFPWCPADPYRTNQNSYSLYELEDYEELNIEDEEDISGMKKVATTESKFCIEDMQMLIKTIPQCSADFYTPNNMFVTSNTCVGYAESDCNEAPCKQAGIKKEEDSTMTIQLNERSYLERRLRDVRDEKVSKARDHFNVDYFPRPKTGKELKEWFASGRVQICENLKDDTHFQEWGDEPHNYIEFIDPDKKRDPESYEKVRDQIYADTVPVKDTINVLSSIDGLKALQEFESKTYH